jgi:hypothetical protein
MMQTTSISDVNWCCCKWVENRSRFRSSKSICAGRGKIAVALLSGSSTARLRDVSGRTIGGLIGGAHNSAYTAMTGYGMGTPPQPVHG